MLTRHQVRMFIDELKKSKDETLQRMLAVIESYILNLEKDVDKLSTENYKLRKRVAELEGKEK